MKISRTGSTTGTSSTSKKKKTSDSGGFASALAEASDAGSGSASIEGPSETSAVSGLEAILAAQSVNDSTEDQNRRAMVQRAEDILERLDEIRQGILLGRFSKDRLANLAQMIRNKRQAVEDPELIELLDEVELRAEVEIAKLTRSR